MLPSVRAAVHVPILATTAAGECSFQENRSWRFIVQDAQIRRLAFIVSFGLLAVGCTSLPESQRQSLRRASSYYLQGNMTSAMAQLDAIIAGYPSAAEIGEAYYIRGLCRAHTGQTASAKSDFQQAVRAAGHKELTARAKASLATIAYSQKDWSTAAKLYADALPNLPDTPPKDKMLYYAGLALRRNGRWSKAQQQFSLVLHKFRNRPVAAAARRQATWKHQFFSIQLGAFRSTTRAGQQVETFHAQGLDAFQEHQLRNGTGLWLVMTGRYPTYEEAVKALNCVRRIQSDAYIIP